MSVIILLNGAGFFLIALLVLRFRYFLVGKRLSMLERLAAGTSLPIDLLDSTLHDMVLSVGGKGGFISIDSLEYFEAVVGSMRSKRKGGREDSIWVSDFAELQIPTDGVAIIKNNVYVYLSPLGWFVGIDGPVLSKDKTVKIIREKIKTAYPVYHQIQTQQKRRNDRDHLTGLMTRRQYFETLAGSLRVTAVKGLPLYVFYMDFNNFKSVNDVLGHDMGDRVLVSLSAEIRKCFLGVGNIYRLGGDEFSGLAVGISDEKADMLKKNIEQITEQRPCGMYVNISVGFVKITPEMVSVDELGSESKVMEHFISIAEADMYVHKKNKKHFEINCEMCPKKK